MKILILETGPISRAFGRDAHCPVFSLKTALSGLAAPLQRLPRAGLDAKVWGGSLIALANEAPTDRIAMIGLGNEFSAKTADGWAVIPYGDHPNERGMQHFGREQADQMVGYFKNTWNQLKRAFVGMPILRGHPDMAASVKKELAREKDQTKRAGLQALINSIDRRYPDKTVYGTVSDMEARDDGLAIKPILTEAGAALVNEGGLNFFSPHWLGMPLDPVNGKAVFAPVLMLSIGLTDKPNIAGTSLVNDEPESLSPMNKALLIQLLAALGRPLANEATDEQLNAGLTEGLTAAKALAARPEMTALVNEQGRATELSTKLTTAETALVNERDAHKATVKARNELLVTNAITAGRITEAAKPTWLGRLERDFATESVALANETGAIKTEAKTRELGNRKTSNTARDQFTALVNERVAKGENYDFAWHAVKTSTSGKALFEQMEATAAK